MGQKVHPTGIRLGIVKDWASRWYADSKAFPKYIAADHEIRVYIKKKLKDAPVSSLARRARTSRSYAPKSRRWLA